MFDEHPTSTANSRGSSKISCSPGYWARDRDYSISYVIVQGKQGMLCKMTLFWSLPTGILQ